MTDEYTTHPPIRAFRQFLIVGGELRPLVQTYDTVFVENKVYHAECTRAIIIKLSYDPFGIHHPESIPEESCTCGFYAWKKRRDCARYSDMRSPAAAMGEVLLGGKIIETELGYRAEQMIIVKLFPQMKRRVSL
jgi:hypothetical protein